MTNGHVIKWVAVFFLSIFDGAWLTIVWLAVFRERGFDADEGGWVDRDETPFKFWLGIALWTAFGLGAVAFTVLVATR